MKLRGLVPNFYIDVSVTDRGNRGIVQFHFWEYLANIFGTVCASKESFRQQNIYLYMNVGFCFKFFIFAVRFLIYIYRPFCCYSPQLTSSPPPLHHTQPQPGFMQSNQNFLRSRKPRIREHTGSVIGGRVPATQGSSGPCVYCRKPGVRSLYTCVAS
jgi:hypothetical protein